MKKIIKKYGCLIAIFWIATPVILPTFSLAFTQVIHAEEAQESDFYEEEHSIDESEIEDVNKTILVKENKELEVPILEFEPPVAMEAGLAHSTNINLSSDNGTNLSQSITSENELILALANEQVSEIIVNGAVPVSNPVYVNRRVKISMGPNSRIDLNNQGSLIILESGIVEIGGGNFENSSNMLVLNSENKTEGTSLIIDGGQLLLLEGPDYTSFSYMTFQWTGVNNNPITAIEVKNGGILNSSGVLRIQNTHPDSVGIRLNNGIFNELVSNKVLSSYIRSGYSIVSETGSNTHKFNYSRIDGEENQAPTLLYSKQGTPVYTNDEVANLTVDGYFEQMIMWGLESSTNANWNDAPDFALGEFNFLVNQVGRSTPTIQSISDPIYSFFFLNGIFPNFRALMSRNGDIALPSVRLPESIEITPSVNMISVDQKIQLLKVLTPDPSQLDNSTVFWSSSNSDVARVDERGEVTGVKQGEAVVKGQTINGLEASVTVRVEEFTFDFSGTEGNSTAVVTGYLGNDTNIEIPATAINHEASWTSPSPVVGIGNSAFTSRGLTNVLIPDSITEIENQAFYRNSLTSLVIPDTITRIGQLAFAENRLTELSLGNKITAIETQAFGDNLLTTIDIPISIERIGTMAFHSNRLTNVMIPESVSELGLRTFENNLLNEVTFLGEVTSIGAQVFALNPLKEILVEDSSLAHYQARLSSNIMSRVTERTVLTVEESRYSEDTQVENNLMSREKLSFSVVSKNRFQLVNLSSYLWEEFNPVVQWFKNDELLKMETNQNFKIAEVEESDSGSYYAIVDGTQLSDLFLTVSPLIQPDIPAINPEDGILELENTNSIVEGLSLRYVSDLEFYSTIFSPSKQTLIPSKSDENPKVTVQDMRPISQRNGWELQVRQNHVFADGAELIFNPFIHELNQNALKISAHSEALTINTEAQRFAGTTTSENPSGIVTMGMGSVAGEGVSLEIPGGAGIGSYETELVWNLVAGPDADSKHVSNK